MVWMMILPEEYEDWDFMNWGASYASKEERMDDYVQYPKKKYVTVAKQWTEPMTKPEMITIWICLGKL